MSMDEMMNIDRDRMELSCQVSKLLGTLSEQESKIESLKSAKER